MNAVNHIRSTTCGAAAKIDLGSSRSRECHKLGTGVGQLEDRRDRTARCGG